MFIPQEDITIVIDSSGSMSASPGLQQAFQKIVRNIEINFPHYLVRLYSLGGSLKELDVDDYLAFNKDELMHLTQCGSAQSIEILKIQNIGPKLFLTDGIMEIERELKYDRNIFVDWIITFEYDYNNYYNYCNRRANCNMIPFSPSKVSQFFEGQKEIEIKNVTQKIIDKIVDKNITVTCNKYKTILVL
jgi:hypothetical protein